MNKLRFYVFGLILMAGNSAYGEEPHLHHAHVDVNNKASLQTGAKLFMNFCAACHTLKYLRYNRLAQDLELVDYQGQIDTKLLDNLIFTGAKAHEPIVNAMPKEEASKWFGVEPPDLSLIARIRSADWLYSYLTGFYTDPSRPFGVNNLVYPDVAMPNVLVNMQGEQFPLFHEEKIRLDGMYTSKTVEGVLLLKKGMMYEQEFNSAVNDLVTFLVYVSEPTQTKRIRIGVGVILFLLILLAVVYCLKKNYWKNIR
jgi:ubiquinol-cytochrome c reductase cytochrome c1 subunit